MLLPIEAHEKYGHEFFGEKELLIPGNVKFEKYLMVHSEIVYIAVFPKQTIVEVFKTFQQNYKVVEKLQNQRALCRESDALGLREETRTDLWEKRIKALESKVDDTDNDTILCERVRRLE